MRTPSILLGAAALLTALAPRAAAQIVRGQIVDQETAAPIQGAFIRLVDTTGVAQAGVLSDNAGNFILTAPRAGRYTLRAERIGYASSFSDTLAVAAGQTVLYRFGVPVQAISLEGLEVTGSKRCNVPTEVGAETSVLWNEARKALDVVAWMEAEQGVPFQNVMWARTRDIRSLDVQEGERRMSSGFGKSAFRSETAESLARDGFVRKTASGGFIYFGLDAQTLLSDAFLEGHCFRVAKTPKDRKDLIGLSFEPLGRSGPPDIEGTLWLDRYTSELRSLEFHYTRLPFDTMVPNTNFGGWVEFQRISNGAWIVGRWWLRMPAWGTVPPESPSDAGMRRPGNDPLSRARRNGLRVREEGGQVVLMARPRSPTDSGTAALEGQVWDSVRARPLAGATVFVTDAGKAVVTDLLGRFRMSGLPPGHHELAFFHPFTDSLQLRAPTRDVDLRAGKHTNADLGLPADAGCPSSSRSATVVGFVQSASDGQPVPGVVVTGNWRELRPRQAHQYGREGAAVMEPVEDTTSTDARGRYLFCGVPLGEPVGLQATTGRSVNVMLQSPGIHSEDLIAGGTR